MRVLVCGGRTFDEWRTLARRLDEIHAQAPIKIIIEGGAAGADQLARKWAAVNKVPCMEFPAHWHHMGRAAGPVRNGWMLEFGKPNIVLAFPGGRGTESMKRLAHGAGVEVVEYA